MPVGLPALTRAAKLTAPRRARRLRLAGCRGGAGEAGRGGRRTRAPNCRRRDPARLRDEVGDLLFVLANLARKLDLDPEACLRHANDKFARRFNAMEQAAATEGKSLAEMPLEEMEQEWQKIKHIQRSTG